MYTTDMPEIRVQKFQYADDTALLQSIYADMHLLKNYFKRWRLKPCAHAFIITTGKHTDDSSFSTPVQFESHPTYLGVKLDQTVT